jgi:hypothetical protein
MATLSQNSARSGVAKRRNRASIREACLIGSEVVPRRGLDEGDSLKWAGRVYRVVATDGGRALHVRPLEISRR